MKKVYLIHGFGGLPNGGWFPYLMKEIAKEKIFACSLPMPNPKNPVLSEWILTMNQYIGENDQEVILMAHSAGVPALLHFLEQKSNDKKFGGVVLVSGFIEPLENGVLDSRYRKIDQFTEGGFDFEKIKNSSEKFVVLHGDKDDRVPIEQSKKISEKLDCEFVVIKNGDHFSQLLDPICYELPEVLEVIKKMLSVQK